MLAPPSILPPRPWTTWLPLAIVLGVSIIKEAVEDYRRAQADHEVNNRPVNVLNHETKAFEEKRWKDVKVGQIIEVKRDQFFPADVLFLTAENEEGTCYIETMNLDGETNLKIKKAPDESKDFTSQTISQFTGASIQCEPPNSRLYQFTGNLLLGDKKLSLSPASILLRGCSLRNTEHVLGAVIYAGVGMGRMALGTCMRTCMQGRLTEGHASSDHLQIASVVGRGS